MTRQCTDAERPYQGDKRAIKFFESIHEETARARAALIQQAVEAMKNCKAANECGLPGCGKCAARIAEKYAADTLSVAVQHVRTRAGENNILGITLTAEGENWNGSVAQSHAQIESDVIQRVIPFFQLQSDVGGVTLHVDFNLIDGIPAMSHEREVLMLAHNAEWHGHLHGQVAIRGCNINDSHLQKLADQWTRAINRKASGTILRVHLKSLASNDAKFATSLSSVAAWTSYSSKARTHIENAPLTRVVRGELVGATLHWHTGLYEQHSEPTELLKLDIQRLARVRESFECISSHLDGIHQSESSGPLGNCIRRATEAVGRAKDELAKLESIVKQRLTCDQTLKNTHGTKALTPVWSEDFHEYTPPAYALTYFKNVRLLNAQFVKTRKSLGEWLSRVLRLLVRLHRNPVFGKGATKSEHAAPSGTADACELLLRHVRLASTTYAHRIRLKRLVETSCRPDSHDEMSADRQIREMVDSLQRQNEVFPGWLFSDHAHDLQQREWWIACGEMLLT